MKPADPPLVLSLDQGTTNSKAVLVTDSGRVVGSGSAPVALFHPRPGWVEQDADQIWSSVVQAIAACLKDREPRSLVGMTLSTQRESVVAWSRETGGALAPLLGWQDRRTAEEWGPRITDADDLVRSRTGLQIDAMFSAPKMRWLLDHLAGHPVDDICVGTVDAWLVWRLTDRTQHACDAGNASRTLLYDVKELGWAADLLELFGVPAAVLPDVLASNANFGQTRAVPGVPDGLPIIAVMADSHAALFGQGCTEVGTAKATYGTGTSVMAPEAGFTGRRSPVPTTLAWLTDRPMYAREGNILSSGAALAWTARLLGLPGVGELVALAGNVPDSGGVTLVPGFSGLGSPHWNRDVRARLTGMTSGTAPAHVARAALEAVAHQVCDIVEVIEADSPRLTLLRADGGATAAPLLMQIQADLLDTVVEVAPVAEVSAVGAARLGWQTLGAPGGNSISSRGAGDVRAGAAVFSPSIGTVERSQRRDAWREEIASALNQTSKP